MKKSAIYILALSMLFLGCEKQQQSNLFESIKSQEIKTVVFGIYDSESIRYLTNAYGKIRITTNGINKITCQEIPIKQYFQITNAATIASLWSQLTPVPLTNEPDASVTFSGILSQQFFLDSKGNVIADADVICYDSQVLAANNNIYFTRDDRSWLLRTNNFQTVALHRPEYCRSVVDLMWSNAPNEIVCIENLLKATKRSIEAELFVRTEDKQYMRKNMIYQLPDMKSSNSNSLEEAKSKRVMRLLKL